jgi:hypothetical protein
MRVEHTNIRTGERWPFHGAVQVSWQTTSGEMKTIRAKCLDLSDQGTRIECDSPIDFRTRVYVQAPAFGLMGNATVRYCRRSGMRHTIGLQFSSAASEADQGRRRLIQHPPSAEK